MKVELRFTVAAVLLVAFAVGCTCMQKPWGRGALAGAAVGAIGGGIATGAATNNTGAFDIGDDNEDKALAIGTGAVGGAVIGAIIGHCLWDYAPMTPAPPPPPPVAAPPPAPPVQQKIVLRGVNFDFDKAAIRPDAASILREAASILKENAGVNVSVEGHTDAVGTEEANLELSQRRARAVYEELVSAHGVDANRLRPRGCGEAVLLVTDPRSPRNRRVEVINAGR